MPDDSLNARTCGGAPGAVKTPHPFVAPPLVNRKVCERDDQAASGTLIIAQPHSRQNLRRKSWAITHRASLVVFPFWRL